MRPDALLFAVVDAILCRDVTWAWASPEYNWKAPRATARLGAWRALWWG